MCADICSEMQNCTEISAQAGTAVIQTPTATDIKATLCDDTGIRSFVSVTVQLPRKLKHDYNPPSYVESRH